MKRYAIALVLGLMAMNAAAQHEVSVFGVAQPALRSCVEGPEFGHLLCAGQFDFGLIHCTIWYDLWRSGINKTKV